jgi:hypothetical protein
MSGGGKASHVDADLGQDALGGALADPVIVVSRSPARAKGRPASLVWVSMRVSTRSSRRAIAVSRSLTAGHLGDLPSRQS